ncbi:MAG: Xaa-Pro aminopeptidase [Methanofollis sp.]|nr:Xaa-Pro aminopeptidase [Methanofollis sp.]
MKRLDDAVAAAGCAAYVTYASSQDADFRYLTRFQVSDALLYIKRLGEEPLLVVPQMEYARAAAEAAAVPVTRADAGYLAFLDETKDPWNALAQTAAALAGGPALVPEGLPYRLGRLLEGHGNVVVDTGGAVGAMRAVKTSRELAAIRTAQRATAAAVDLGIGMIRRSSPKSGVLVLDGETLTAERVKTAMHVFLMGQGCIARETIVSCGEDSAMPHRQGAGPLRPDEPIVFDVFPQHDQTGYYADMSRTVVKGEPSPEIREMHRAVLDAQTLGESLIRAGVAGADVHNAVVKLFDEQGYESGARGFVHSLGHGVGLEVHESPSLSPSGGPLVAGNVVTVEPGLYYPGIGGVRIEDMGVVAAGGFDCYTDYNRDLIL